MSEEIARLKAAHIDELERLVQALQNILYEFRALLRYWKAEENPVDEPPAKEFDGEK